MYTTTYNMHHMCNTINLIHSDNDENISIQPKYKVFVVAYKNIDDKIKNIVTKYSVFNIKNKDVFLRQTNYQGSGRNFNLNDRISIYLGWFKDEIIEKLDEGYNMDIIEIHRSYDDPREHMLKALNTEYGDNIVLLGTELI